MKNKQRVKLYTIGRYNEKGQLECYIDASLCSMGWSTEACYLYTSIPSNSLQKGEFIIRIHSKKSPINVSLKNRWARRSRNYAFTMKD